MMIRLLIPLFVWIMDLTKTTRRWIEIILSTATVLAFYLLVAFQFGIWKALVASVVVFITEMVKFSVVYISGRLDEEEYIANCNSENQNGPYLS